MAIFTYDSEAERIGKLKGKLFKHAIPIEVLSGSAEHHKQPKNSSRTVVFRRWLPFGGATTNATTINQWVVDPNAHIVQDGVTPTTDSIVPQNITVTLKQYAALYSYTDVVADTYEDDIPSAMIEQAGERITLVNELVDWGALKSNTNTFFAGGTSRATVDKAIDLKQLRLITRNLQNNRAKLINERLQASPDYNTAPVEPSYVVYAHTNLASDIRDLQGFIHKAEYGTFKPIHEQELGSVEEFRFVVSPELDFFIDSGALVGNTGLLSTNGVNVDVYPIAVIARYAWGTLALRGENAITPIHIPHDQKSKSDPLGQRGYIGARWHKASFIQNDGWMALLEAGASALTN